jgi:putative tricarboxylic transport membrane protein
MATGPRWRWRHPDVRAAAAVLALAASAFVVTLGFETVPESLMEGMGPERFPQLVILVMAGFALALLWRARTLPPDPLPRIPPMVPATVALIAAAVAALPFLGVVPTMTAAMAALSFLWGERRVVRVLAIALLFGAAVHLLFVRTLGITLPVGPFGTLLG